MGGKRKAPPPPDYRGAAQEQSAADKWNTRYQTHSNRPNMNTPWGQSSWEMVTGPDGMPQWTNNVTLSPEQQQAMEAQQRIQMGRTNLAEQMLTGNRPPQYDSEGNLIESTGVSNEMTTPDGFWEGLQGYGKPPPTFQMGDLPESGFIPQQRPMEQLPGLGGMPQGTQVSGLPRMADYSQFAGMVGGPGDQSNEGMLPGYEGMTQFQQTGPSEIQMGIGGGQYDPRFAEANYEREMSMLGPRQEQDMAAQESQLRNQGLRPGTEAYDSALQNLRTQQGEENDRLRYASVLRGADEQQREFGRGLQQGQFANQAAGQQFGQNMGMADQAARLRGQQFGELNQLAQMRGGGEDARFQRAMQLAGAQNQLRGQEFNQQMGYGDQQFGQQMGQAQLQDSRRAQEFGQQMQYGSRDFAEQMAQSQLMNQMRGQEYAQQMGYGDQQFNQNMQQSQYMNQLRQSQIAEQMQREGWSLNKVNALLSGQQVGMPQFQNFTNSGKAQAPQWLQAAGMEGNYNMNAWQGENAQNSAFWNALGGIGGGLAGNAGLFG